MIDLLFKPEAMLKASFSAPLNKSVEFKSIVELACQLSPVHHNFSLLPHHN
jgi:hypothetical protein